MLHDKVHIIQEEDRAMRKVLGVALVAVLVLGVSGMAMARWGGPGMGPGGGWGPGEGMGGRAAGFGPGRGPCHNQQGVTQATATAVDEAKAKEIASEYVSKNLPGYHVEKLVKFDRPRGAMYQIEVKGPQGELQYLHINPWGNVRAFGVGRAL
jgi:hypothetical protein